MSKMKKYFYFLLILILGFFLRFYRLGDIPSGFHQDEVVNAYVGKFILLNGKDLYGIPWPIFYFDKWGDYPPVLPMYFSGLGSLLFGDSVFGARVIVAFFGLLTIISFYFFIQNLFHNDQLSLLGSFLLAINPWHIAFSRTAAEGILASFFYISGLALYFSQRKNFLINFFISFSFLFAFLSYPGFRLIIPLTLLILLIFYFQKKEKIPFSLIINFIIFFILLIFFSLSSWGNSRFSQTSIFNEIKIKKEYFNQFIYNENSVFLARFFNNKLVYLTRIFLTQFFTYFSLVYLFLNGGNPPWFAIPNFGLFYLFQLFLIIVYFFVKENDKKIKKIMGLIFSFLLINVFPASLTIENSPHMHRSLPMLFFIILISIIGWKKLIKLFNKKIILFFYLFLLMEFIYFVHNYFQHVSMFTAIPRSDGNQKMAIYLAENKNQYQRIYFYVSGWFPIYYLYFSSNYQSSLIGQIQKGMRTNQLDNIFFFNQDCPKKEEIERIKLKDKDLLIFSSTCQIGKKWMIKPIKSINNINRTPVYWLYQKASF